MRRGLRDADAAAIDRFVASLAGTPLEGAVVRSVPASLEDVFIALSE